MANPICVVHSSHLQVREGKYQITANSNDRSRREQGKSGAQRFKINPAFHAYLEIHGSLPCTKTSDSAPPDFSHNRPCCIVSCGAASVRVFVHFRVCDRQTDRKPNGWFGRTESESGLNQECVSRKLACYRLAATT